MEWSWATWAISVVAVAISGLLAWHEGCWGRRPGLAMGFANHGGMWGDVLLLPMANAAIVPHLTAGPWIAAVVLVASMATIWAHIHWYRGRHTTHCAEHMWPSRPHGRWWRDLSRAGWAHLVYMTGELTVLIGFALFPMPAPTVALVCVILSLHVPLGLLQPRWFLTGKIASPRKQPLLAPSLAAVWIVAIVKLT